MAKTLQLPSKAEPGFTLGRRGFAKISAVEGIALTPAMEAQFQEFDAQSLPAAERREALRRQFGKSR